MMAPGQVDALVAFLRDTAIPAARSQRGYRSSRVFVNRQTGRALVSTVWDTAADRESSEAAMAGLRRQAAEVSQASGQVKVTLYEVILAELSPAAQQATISVGSAA
jgi:hypothetical protein